jgi:hypothetical protein
MVFEVCQVGVLRGEQPVLLGLGFGPGPGKLLEWGRFSARPELFTFPFEDSATIL